MSEIIQESGIRRIAEEWIGAGKIAAGPVVARSGGVLYSRLGSAAELVLDGFVRPRNSIKELFFPRHEKLFSYKIAGQHIELADAEPAAPPQLVLAARPCDAAALPVLDHVFNWDYKDDFYNERRKATTVVTLACKEHDNDCFCTSVGGSPESTRGSDAMLLSTGGGAYEVCTFTDRGRELFAGRTQEANTAAGAARAPETRFSPDAIRAFVRKRFEDPLWAEATLACLGCGACAYTCPACHCFDIVHERASSVKNWDSCQFPMFTSHASGHNPRATQAQRQRQRVYHKFHIYPEKFGEILCTGCGNCARNCPVGLGVLPLLEAIQHAEHI